MGKRDISLTVICLAGICFLLGIFLLGSLRKTNGTGSYLRALIASSFAKATVDFIFEEIGAYQP